MKIVHRALCAFVMLCLLSAALPATSGPRAHEDGASSPARTPAASFRSGEVLVRFAGGADRARISARAGLGSRARLAVPGWERVSLRDGDSVEGALSRLRGVRGVSKAEPNRIYAAAAMPDDPRFIREWGLNNTGQTGGTTDADIDAPEAWNITKGSASIVVGVVDTGVAYTHPDLEPNIWSNAAEVPGNGLDDDENGYTDDVKGWDFFDDDADPKDEHLASHGTHVAGAIGARGFDGYGVSGVSPNVSIMALRVLGPTGSGTSTDIAEAFTYAAANGAHVVNASLGGPGFDPYLADAIARSPETLFVVAAGNDGENNDTNEGVYPCNFTFANLICVAATSHDDTRASFSNFGRNAVDIGAPGANVYSSYLPVTPATTGVYSLADSHAGYANNANTWIRTANPIDLSGRSDCRLDYAVRADLQSGDKIHAERSTDGVTWLSLEGLLGTTGGSFSIRSPGLLADNHEAVSVRFRFASNASGTDDGVFIDDVKVICSSGTVWSDSFETGLEKWTTDAADAPWTRTRVAGRWAYMSGTSMATPIVSGAAALLFAKRPGSTVAHIKNVLLGSIDKLSTLTSATVSGGRLNAWRALVYVPDVTAPVGQSVRGLPVFARARSFGLTWSADDSGPAGSRKQFGVRYRRTSYKGASTSYKTWLGWTSATTKTLTGSAGNTYCFSVRARDGAWNATGYGTARCIGVPVNDRSMVATASWTRKLASDRYLGTYTYGRTLGATLKLTDVRYKRLAFIATKCPGCGTVEVWRGGTKLGRYSLAASAKRVKQVIAVQTRSTLSTAATITIRIVSSGKPVHIEGLAVRSA